MPSDDPELGWDEQQLTAAVAAISEPERMRTAQEVVMRLAPQLQQVLAAALAEGGWFDTAHAAAVREALSAEDPVAAVRTLCAEETRLGMLVGVAVGFELARELDVAPT